MVLIKSLIVLIACQLGVAQAAEDAALPSHSVEKMVERINQRYDDFFRYHRELEERWQKRRESIGDRKKLEAAQKQKLEESRLEYVKNRKPRASNEPLRLRWEAEQKERASQVEMLRRRYVQQRDEVERYLKKGRQIPEMKEFDLEGY